MSSPSSSRNTTSVVKHLTQIDRWDVEYEGKMYVVQRQYMTLYGEETWYVRLQEGGFGEPPTLLTLEGDIRRDEVLEKKIIRCVQNHLLKR